VIVFDNRGVLTTTRGRGRLTIQRMADDTAGLIRALGYRRADVLGWSMGGTIAQELALRHPGRVRRLVLAATDPGSSRAIQPTSPLARRVLNDPNPTIQELLRAIFPPTKQAAANAYVRRLLLWPGVQPSDFNASPEITREQTVAGEGSSSAAAAGPTAACRACERPPSSPMVAATSSSRRATRGSLPAASRAHGSPSAARPATPSCSSAAPTSPRGSTPSSSELSGARTSSSSAGTVQAIGPGTRAWREVTLRARVKASASAQHCDARKGRESACDDQQERPAPVLLLDGCESGAGS